MKSKGLGDSIHKFTKATGIKSAVDRVSKGLNIPCGCEGRREAMNIMFPYKKQIMAKKTKKSPCWKGYMMVGMKKKGGRNVPNCVPKKKPKKG